MSRYVEAQGVEAESEPGSRGRVLRNFLGLARKRDVDEAEAEALLSAQLRYLSIVHQKQSFSAAFICQMHRDWLGRIYSWAGKYRTVEVSKGRFTWPPAFRVAANMESLEKNVLSRVTPCRGGHVDGIAMALAEVQAELLLVHPFREGNGRTARWLTDLMSFQAGYPALDYGFRGPGSKARRDAYLRAVIAGYSKNYAPLARVLVEALTRRLVRGADRESFNPRAPSK